MPRKPAKDQSDTRGLILEKAFALFGRFGYEGVSIGDIARETKLSKGALYWHYKGKDALYLDCMARLHGLFDQHIFDPMRKDNLSFNRMMLMFKGLANFLQDEQTLTGISGYWLIARNEKHLIDVQREFEERSIELLAETMRLGVKQGRFNFGDDLENMARTIMALIEATVLPLRHHDSKEIHDILGVLARTLFRAYASPADLKAMSNLL